MLTEKSWDARRLADAICQGIREVDPALILLGLSGSCLLDAGRDLGLRCASEVFADRAYEDDGSLTPRGQEGAVITDEEEAIARVLQMVQQGTVQTRTGKIISIQADSVCLHGDGEKAVEFAKRIHSSLNTSGVKVVSLSELFNR